MERFIMQDLIAWKNREDRKPLILLGARQVGKTYILKEFGQREFENVAYIMAKHADKDAVPSSVEEWLDSFEVFSIYQVLPEILTLWNLNTLTTAKPKKKQG